MKAKYNTKQKTKFLFSSPSTMLEHPPDKNEVDWHCNHVYRNRGKRLINPKKQEQVEQDHVEEIVVEVGSYETFSALNRSL